MSEFELIEVHYNKEHDTLNVGDTISTTTSSFEYNNVTGWFDSTDTSVMVKAVKTGKDYTDYDSNRCRTGGCYGYDYYEVIEIIEDD